MLKYHIQTVELTSGQAAISFNSIPQDFTDLYILMSARTNRVLEGDGFYLRFNNNSSGYTQRRLIGSGSGVSSDTQTGVFFTTAANATANTFGNSSIYVPNYTGNAFKSYSNDGASENNATTSYLGINAGLWSNTAAISSIVIVPEGGTEFVTNSSFSLYGVRRGDDRVTKVSPIATGGTVTTSGGYTIHTFTSSGTFSVNRAFDAEYLVVAGGGGGGQHPTGAGAGGGGAGGYRLSVPGELSGGNSSAESRLFLSPGAYSVIVGAGGAAGSSSNGISGGPSVFASIVSDGGGGGARGNGGGTSTGNNGGSGGGAGAGSTGSVPGTATPGQGFAGGLGGNQVSAYSAGGGGGAGSTGFNTSGGNTGGAGGTGATSSITGSSVTRAGGGGGAISGQGGAGGGGNGGAGNGTGQTAGSANTGGGGGGGYGSGSAAAGGSGIVIIRYLTP
jgi:hypothetical protein